MGTFEGGGDEQFPEVWLEAQETPDWQTDDPSPLSEDQDLRSIDLMPPLPYPDDLSPSPIVIIPDGDYPIRKADDVPPSGYPQVEDGQTIADYADRETLDAMQGTRPASEADGSDQPAIDPETGDAATADGQDAELYTLICGGEGPYIRPAQLAGDSRENFSWWFTDGERAAPACPQGDESNLRPVRASEAAEIIATHFGESTKNVAGALKVLRLEPIDALNRWHQRPDASLPTYGALVTATLAAFREPVSEATPSDNTINAESQTTPTTGETTSPAAPLEPPKAEQPFTRQPGWFNGASQSSGATRPRVAGIHDARPVRRGEATGLIADYFDTGSQVVREVLDELGIEDVVAFNRWEQRIDYRDDRTVGAHVTAAIRRRLQGEESR